MEQAAEKYSEASAKDPSSIFSLIKWGAALSRCGVSRFKLDLEYNSQLFSLAEQKFEEAEEIYNSLDVTDVSSPINCSDPLEDLPSPFLKKSSHSQGNISRKDSKTVLKSNPGTMKMKLIKSSTPRLRFGAPVSVDRSLDNMRQTQITLYIEWGRSLQRHAMVQEELGEFKLALDMYLRSCSLFSDCLDVDNSNIKALKCWGKVMDCMGMLKGLSKEDMDEITKTTKDYLGTFVHISNKELEYPPSLNPLIALVISTSSFIQQADPLNSLRQIARNCDGDLKKQAMDALVYVERLLPDIKAGESFSIIQLFHIEDAELGLAHMPDSAKRLFDSSGLSYDIIRDHTELVVNLLLFLTPTKDWPQALLKSISYRRPKGLPPNLPPIRFKKEDPRRKYRNRISIGYGSFSEVFTARVRGSKTNNVAIKVFNQNYSQAKKDIDREIILLNYLKHPNLIECLNCYLWHDIVWIVMDYCDGGSLKELVESDCIISEPQIAYFAKEILSGLSHLHAYHIAHRDIKSNNILLHLDGKVKIGDLGVSVGIQDSEIEVLPMVGSCYWMAPEIIKGLPYGFKADIWSFGCVLLELANGMPPRFQVPKLKGKTYLLLNTIYNII